VVGILNSLYFLHVQLQSFLTIGVLHFEEWGGLHALFFAIVVIPKKIAK
jgi:hypothetical protein